MGAFPGEAPYSINSDYANRIYSKWPNEDLIPGFRDTMEKYLYQVQTLSYQFISLLSEAFGLAPDALNKFYDTDELMQHRGKVSIE